MIRVKAAFFSLTPPPPPDDDGSYLRWHLLDHMVEQYQLPGIQYALRYIADGEYLERRIVATGHLEDVGNVVNYLVGDPVQQTHDDFMELGPRLAEMGRFPEVRPSLQLRMPALLRWYASPQAVISPEVVPFRPHRGVVVIVIEEPVGAWTSIRGCTGFTPTTFRRCSRRQASPVPGCTAPRTHGNCSLSTQGDPQYTTVVYLDDDPLATDERACSVVERTLAIRRGPAIVCRSATNDDRVGGVALTWTTMHFGSYRPGFAGSKTRRRSGD